MTKRTMHPTSILTTKRNRAALLLAGLGATAALGTGVASAADGGHGEHAPPHTTAAEKAQQARQNAGAHDWITPVAKYDLSATFGTGGGMWAHKHSGQDFAVDVGTPVDAVHGGTVVKAGPGGAGDGSAYGNAIVIDHGDGKYTQYAHLSKIDVKVGQTLKTGDHIAESGNTGNSSGPHLHFEVRNTPNYGSAIDPAKFMKTEGLSF